MGDILIFKMKEKVKPKKKTESQLKLEYIADKIHNLYENIENINSDKHLQLQLISACSTINSINVYAISANDFTTYNELSDKLEIIIAYEQKRIRLSRFQLIKCS